MAKEFEGRAKTWSNWKSALLHIAIISRVW